MNSLLPLGAPAANVVNTMRMNMGQLNNKLNAVMNTTNTKLNEIVNNTNKALNSGSGYGWLVPLGIFVAFIVLFLLLLGYYGDQMKQGLSSFWNTIKDGLGISHSPTPPLQIDSSVTGHPVAPQNETDEQKHASKSIVDKMLPNTGSLEVFNVSKNTFSYNDAAPLCKAMGAELATYEQVKKAWEKGADWCNYGWVKGQVAVFPTQKETWSKIQAGPEEDRTSCGVPGLNGGYFDNPELHFGVNCYGPKPSQSQHDATSVTQGQPLTPAGLEIDKKVAHFRTEASSLGIMPFSSEKWSA